MHKALLDLWSVFCHDWHALELFILVDSLEVEIKILNAFKSIMQSDG